MTRLLYGLGRAVLGLVLLSPLVRGQVTERASVATGGGQADHGGTFSSISSDGRFVVFESGATNLVAGFFGWSNVFVRDRQTGATEVVSMAMGGVQSFGNSYGNAEAGATISADGRYVAFQSLATDLVPGDTNGFEDIFVRDRLLGTTERISVATSGAQGNGGSGGYSISADGRFVAFTSDARNLVPGDTNGIGDVFVRDRDTDNDGVFDEPGAVSTERVSVATGGVQGNGQSTAQSISSDGRFVAFGSGATNLVAGDTNGFDDVFVHDRLSGATERVSVASGGAQADNLSAMPWLSVDGRFVAFFSFATNLVAGDTNAAGDVFVHDRQTGATERVSVATGGGQANDFSGRTTISGDGRFVAFQSWATNLAAGDTNGMGDVFIRDRLLGTTKRVSVATGGAQGDGHSGPPVISADGRFVAFMSHASNLVANDTNGVTDVFVHDRACPLASASSRNAGSNPASFTCTAPVLGASWSGTVDLTTTGHSSAYLYAFAAQTTSTLTQGQVLLGSGQLARFGPVAGPLASFSFAVPNDTALCGLHLTTQALHLGAVSPFATSNAMDLVVGQ